MTGMEPTAESDAGTTCLVAVWDDGIYRARCSMGTKGVCAKHGPHRPHPSDGRPCDPNPHDGYCHTHGVYMDPRVLPPAETDTSDPDDSPATRDADPMWGRDIPPGVRDPS